MNEAVEACALSGGDLYCWGYIPQAVYAGTKFTGVSVGRTQTCGVTTVGAVLCWGVGSPWGLPGDAANVIPGTFVAVSSSQDLVCALDTAGTASCYGANSAGMGALGGVAFASISAQFHSACALTAAGAVYCWGSSATACPVVASSSPLLVALPAGVIAKEISNGCNMACALATNGDVYCWGSGYLGFGASGTDTAIHPPRKVPGLAPARHVSVLGFDSVCTISTAGARTCWGYNDYGVVGDGTSLIEYSPEAVP